MDDISSNTPYCADLNIPSVFSDNNDTPTDTQTREPGEIRSDDDCDTSDTTEDILDSIDLADTGLLNNVPENNQLHSGKTDNMNGDQGKPVSNGKNPCPDMDKSNTDDETKASDQDQDHINDNPVDQSSFQKETSLSENEHGNDDSNKESLILPNTSPIVGNTVIKAKSEPITDSNNTTEPNESPTSSEPSVVYGTQPGVISDTLKEMYKNLIRVECKMELNKICERDIRDWMDKEALVENNNESAHNADCKPCLSSDKISNSVLPVKTVNQKGTKKRRPPRNVHN